MYLLMLIHAPLSLSVAILVIAATNPKQGSEFNSHLVRAACQSVVSLANCFLFLKISGRSSCEDRVMVVITEHKYLVTSEAKLNLKSLQASPR